MFPSQLASLSPAGETMALILMQVKFWSVSACAKYLHDLEMIIARSLYHLPCGQSAIPDDVLKCQQATMLMVPLPCISYAFNDYGSFACRLEIKHEKNYSYKLVVIIWSSSQI